MTDLTRFVAFADMLQMEGTAGWALTGKHGYSPLFDVAHSGMLGGQGLLLPRFRKGSRSEQQQSKCLGLLVALCACLDIRDALDDKKAQSLQDVAIVFSKAVD